MCFYSTFGGGKSSLVIGGDKPVGGGSAQGGVDWVGGVRWAVSLSKAL